MFTIDYLLSYLEDPRYPSVGPHLRLLELTGLWHPNLESRVTRFKQYLFYVTVIFFCSQYIKCLIKFDSDSLMLILQYIPFHMGIVKTCFFHKDYTKWERVIHYVSSLERNQLSEKDKKYDEIINSYIKQNRRVTYFFWILAIVSNFGIFIEPYQKNQVNENGTSVYLKIFDGYTPYSQEPPGYYVSMVIQTILGHVVSAYVVGWDMLVVAIMIFFAGQLKITRLNCSKVIVTGNADISYENIVRCHRLHIQLIKYQQVFDSLISPAMFVYLIVISVNLGVCIIQIAQASFRIQLSNVIFKVQSAKILLNFHGWLVTLTLAATLWSSFSCQLQNDLATLMSSCLFVVACLIQLLLFYWHANEVTVESDAVSYSTFESEWTYINQKVQKEVALLGLTTNKKLVFRAGPFNVMSLRTFIAILRGSYSFYTLLSETNN